MAEVLLAFVIFGTLEVAFLKILPWLGALAALGLFSLVWRYR